MISWGISIVQCFTSLHSRHKNYLIFAFASSSALIWLLALKLTWLFHNSGFIILRTLTPDGICYLFICHWCIIPCTFVCQGKLSLDKTIVQFFLPWYLTSPTIISKSFIIKQMEYIICLNFLGIWLTTLLVVIWFIECLCEQFISCHISLKLM